MIKIFKLHPVQTKACLNKLSLLLLMLFSIAFISQAQDDDYYDESDDDYYEESGDDHSNGDSSDDYSSSDYSEDGDYGDDYGGGIGDAFGSSDREEYVPKKIVHKPYIRYIPPYDSTRELVLYKAVIEVKDRDGYEVEIDTINFRTHQWLELEYGKNLKKFLTLDAINENAGEMEYKITIHGTFPCEIQPNEFTTVTNGQVEYDMEIRVRDGRYRYTVKNLVHIADPRPGEKEGERTYFEYLMKSEDDVRAGDRVLIAADKKINTMMAALQKSCQTAPLEEEDDW
ncbi:MAG: hypothetical protein ACI9JN_000032 [Bacteroidia bacterium]|jgi:hypothetical protein